MMIIERVGFSKDILTGKVILITGAGGGIGFEAARSLAYLGADVIIAEINKDKGESAQNRINDELGTDLVTFFHVDITDDGQIQGLYDFIQEKYSTLDILINNATVTPMGAVDFVSISDWDRSYAVNLRAPVFLAQKFLPWMKEKNSGTIVFVPSSGAAPYMGAYEVFKTSQVELCNTLAGELEGTNIITYAIGPGLVRTETAQKAIETVSALMNIGTAEFYKMNESHILDAETAGAGFAASVVNAFKYNGQEIGSIQALIDAGAYEQDKTIRSDAVLQNANLISTHIHNIAAVFMEQYDGWLKRNIFERQWVLRDFKKTVGMAANDFHKLIINVSELARQERFDNISEQKPWFEKLKAYYTRQHKLLQGFEKNPEKLKKDSQTILDWIEELQTAIDAL